MLTGAGRGGMTGQVARRRSGARRGREMPTIVWLMAAAAAWLAAVGATCVLLTAAKRADAAGAADGEAGGSRGRGLPGDDATGLVEPRLSAIVVAVLEPGRARPMSAIAAGGRRPRRLPSP